MKRPEAAVPAFRGAQELRPDIRSYQGLFRMRIIKLHDLHLLPAMSFMFYDAIICCEVLIIDSAKFTDFDKNLNLIQVWFILIWLLVKSKRLYMHPEKQ